jgi:Protein of unknown function DUF262
MNEDLTRDKEGRIPESVQTASESQIVELSKKIEFYLTEYTLELLAQKLGNGDFVIPAYQREFTWEPERKSRFIESLLMGLPVPFLFFWEQSATGKLEVVDGSQRLRTISEFLMGKLELGELEQLTYLERLRFTDLSESRQRKIKNKSIRGIVLNEHADDAARFDLFDRINTGSKTANKAEVRRGALAGPFMDLIIELANDRVFRNLAPLSAKAESERQREELVTRFFAYGDGLEEYRDRVSVFLFDYTKAMNSSVAGTPGLAEELKGRFHRTMKFIQRNFRLGFRRTPDATTTPRARFEAIAVGSYLALKKRESLNKREVNTEDWIDSKEFREVTGSDGANAVNRLRARISFVEQKLLRK